MKLKHTLPLLICGLAACSPAEEGQPQGPAIEQTGMNLRTDVLGDTDVAGMGYAITPVDCDTGEVAGEVIELIRDLEDILLPGGHPGFEDRPFDAASAHLFADAFQALPVGCYDVVATPLDADGQPSGDCAPASAQGVAVADGQVTEVTLISQCQGDDTLGAIDALVALNHEPSLVDAYYADSKFTCQNQATLCVVAEDVDQDPLVLQTRAGDDVVLTLAEPQVNEAGQSVFCVTVEVPGPGEYPITLSVLDQAYDADGNLVPIEGLLGEGQTSRASITMPVHAMGADACICDCPEGFALNADATACERALEAEPVFNGEFMDVCEGDDDDQFGALGAQFPGGLVVRNAFFGQSFDEPSGRLNQVGIWACRATGRNEWIGFTACIDVPEGGEYVIGTAGDDQSRVIIDGQLVFAQAGQASYRTWWMIPVVLTPGVHVIELQGQDSGGFIATLGADIYGPFPAGSTADDAAMAALDYENNVFWTTADQLGGTFQTGTNSGYACPEGTSLNLCGDAPTCTGLQVQQCL